MLAFRLLCTCSQCNHASFVCAFIIRFVHLLFLISNLIPWAVRILVLFILFICRKRSRACDFHSFSLWVLWFWFGVSLMSISLMAVYVDDAVCNITEYTRDSFESLNLISRWNDALFMAAHTLSWTDLSTVFHARNWWNRFGKCYPLTLVLRTLYICVNKNISQFSENFFGFSSRIRRFFSAQSQFISFYSPLNASLLKFMCIAIDANECSLFELSTYLCVCISQRKNFTQSLHRIFLWRYSTQLFACLFFLVSLRSYFNVAAVILSSAFFVSHGWQKLWK